MTSQDENEESENHEWRALGRSQFESAYAPEDAVYDQLLAAPVN